MELKQISETLSVSPQIAAEDLTQLAAQGVRSVICNRPDGEDVDQPTFEDIRAAAQTLGITARYIPVVGGKISDADVAAFRSALAELPGPVLAYCRSGARSTTLWSLSQATGHTSPSIQNAAQVS